MKDTTEILKKIRTLMNQTIHLEKRILAYIVPSDDEHQSEYISAHDERRAFVSGFDGSAGTAVITTEKALLWTDGRYYQQALKQMDVNWTLMKDGQANTPTIGGWLAKNLPNGSFIGVDPKLISFRRWKPIQKELDASDSKLVAIDENLIDKIWEGTQPTRELNPLICLDLNFCGVTVAEKWKCVKEQMISKNAEALVVSALDEIAWFLNMRGSDIPYNPVFFSYLIVTHNELLLFIDSKSLPNLFVTHQRQNNVEIKISPYNEIGNAILQLVDNVEGKIWISPTSSYYLISLVPQGKVYKEVTPIAVNKSVKNATEIDGFINSHIRDGIALCKYFAWLQNQIDTKKEVDEISGACKLEEFRSQQKFFKGLSFPTISSSGPNGAIIHYHPSNETNRIIRPEEIYLCDSGAQYMDGTTDVTRTFHFGEPTEFQKEAYTRVLKGQLTFGSLVFPKKVKGQVLDTIARKSLWDIGLDYAHGTGHGVGHFLNVHEGPMGVGIRLMPDDNGLEENMFISNEPGFYQDGEFGIRIEDIVQIIPANSQYDFSGRGALTFKTITLCPKQTKLIKKELLTSKELQLLNDYHEEVWTKLSVILQQEGDNLTLAWLRNETKAL